MKREKAAIIILILTFVLSLFSLVFINSSCSNLIDNLDETVDFIVKEDINSATRKITVIIETFEKSKPLLNIFIGQSETIEIRGDLNKAIFFLNLKDYESAILYLEECKTDLNRIIVSNTPSVSTIL